MLNRFKTEDEIVAKANATNFGLMAGVFTQDINKAMRVAADIDSGMVGHQLRQLVLPVSAVRWEQGERAGAGEFY